MRRMGSRRKIVDSWRVHFMHHVFKLERKDLCIADIAACFHFVDLHEFFCHLAEAIYLLFHLYHSIIRR